MHGTLPLARRRDKSWKDIVQLFTGSKRDSPKDCMPPVLDHSHTALLDHQCVLKAALVL